MPNQQEAFLQWARDIEGTEPSPEFEDAFDAYSRSSGYVLALPKQTVRDLELEHDRLMHALDRNYRKLVALKRERKDA